MSLLMSFKKYGLKSKGKKFLVKCTKIFRKISGDILLIPDVDGFILPCAMLIVI
jgi:hypothetical protein